MASASAEEFTPPCPLGRELRSLNLYDQAWPHSILGLSGAYPTASKLIPHRSVRNLRLFPKQRSCGWESVTPSGLRDCSDGQNVSERRGHVSRMPRHYLPCVKTALFPFVVCRAPLLICAGMSWTSDKIFQGASSLRASRALFESRHVKKVRASGPPHLPGMWLHTSNRGRILFLAAF